MRNLLPFVAALLTSVSASTGAQVNSPSSAAVPADRNVPKIPDAVPPPPPEIILPLMPPLPLANPLPYEEYREGAFKAAQWSFRSSAAVAFDQLAARFALADSAVGRLERELQQLAAALRAADLSVAEAGPTPDAEVEQNSARIRDLRDKITARTRELQRRFPEYDELVRPRVYDFAQVQRLLRQDEALLVIVNADDATYLFAVTSERAEWFRNDKLRRADLDIAVQALRASLTDEKPSPFDYNAAKLLFEGLIAPAEPVIGQKRRLMTITGGSLATLPLGLLSAGGSQWLADRYVLSTLPSVSSLIALRCLLVDRAARAHGCPSDLQGERARPPAPGLHLFAIGAPRLLGPGVTVRGAPSIATAFRSGPLADANAILRYRPLPHAKAELELLAERYGKRAVVRVDVDATEREVKENADLRRARFIIFSTHGVLAGRVGIVGEPGLIFTPPSVGKSSRLDDGFLTASEAAQLQLNAEFVVLSACNTASARGEALSAGLARAFFFAGARALLVSHWEVNDESTYELMTRTFAELDRGQGKSEALQSAMRAVRGKPAFAHPRYWAAFTLVGAP